MPLPAAVIVSRLRAAGCVFAEEEAAVLQESARSAAELAAMVAARAGGRPLEQVVGWARFRGLRIIVDPGVFVPRRRSEFLVATAIALARPGSSPVVADVCCGTGALGLAAATALAAAAGGAPGCPPASGSGPGEDGAALRARGPTRGAAELHAADLDPAAVACARRNLEPAGGRVYQGDLLAPLPPGLRGRVTTLICNAPYVPTGEIAFMPPEARDHEAPMALDGGGDGLAVLRRVAAQAPGWLAPGGTLLVETSERQAPAMLAAMAAARLSGQVHEDEDSGATVIAGTR
jgi:release factor glutamine methyltransferase